jgi:hypothetical protein
MRPLEHLTLGRPIAASMANGEQCRGVIIEIGEGWLLLGGQGSNGDKSVLVNMQHICSLVLDVKPAPTAIIDAPKPKPASKEAPQKTGLKALGRAWLDEDLQQLADAFLDGHDDVILSQRFSRAKNQIKELRQAFECARGNLVDDQVSAIALTWVPRWRKALRPQ